MTGRPSEAVAKGPSPARTRAKITDTTCPVLPSHVHLRRDPLRQKWVVLAPEKVLWPDDISADILSRCDGRKTVAQIVDGLSTDYNAPPEQIRPDVIGFLQEWSDRLLVRPARQEQVSA
ncbi:pyrroloquinoline quinone biosynthesis peptide chaperone PqqD [Roseibium sp.]|uniref:pyrroloquinoline quinone biosynthesis peptide chaperone PqqD n=1 Tax=Roseibium sp. TaxID=1936156 RepID=UPI003A972C8C